MAENICEDRKPNDAGIRLGSKINGVEGKTPFLIGVAGGTASGKVSVMLEYFTLGSSECTCEAVSTLRLLPNLSLI
jgi:hypothetical protein